MSETSHIEDTVRLYVLAEFLPGEDPEELTIETPLMTTGILDSIRTLKLVSFLEEAFSIRLAAHETDVDHLNTISLIADLVRSKQDPGRLG